MEIWHNPRCSKSRQTLALIQENGVEPNVRLYLETPPTAKELEAVLKNLGVSARDLLRKGEEAYKDKGLGDRSLSDKSLLQAMAAEPKLIERPIVISGSEAVLGRPPENVLVFFK